jgi:Phage integrase family.
MSSFLTSRGSLVQIQRRPPPTNALQTVKHQAEQAGLDPAQVTCHTFRATGITTFLENGGDLETAQHIAGHAPRGHYPHLRPPRAEGGPGRNRGGEDSTGRASPPGRSDRLKRETGLLLEGPISRATWSVASLIRFHRFAETSLRGNILRPLGIGSA